MRRARRRASRTPMCWPAASPPHRINPSRRWNASSNCASRAPPGCRGWRAARSNPTRPMTPPRSRRATRGCARTGFRNRRPFPPSRNGSTAMTPTQSCGPGEFQMYRRSFLSLCAAVVPAIFTPALARADTAYPDRPIQIVVPFAAGSASDVITRILLNRMTISLGQNFVVENRPGAGGNTGTAAVVHAAPDGYTLVMSTSGPLAANKALFRDLGYDPQQDFAPICLFATLPNVVVINAKLPPKTLSELIEYAKEHPGQLNYGSVGVGSSQHLAGAYFEQLTGTKLVHVPYKNIGSYAPDFIADQVPLGFQLLPNVLGLIQNGDA